ncbi:uncharacterized protein DMENIID0001_030610 [Sergentomyia squamirostris]
MERMWRKVNQGFAGRGASGKQTHHQSTETVNSAGFGEVQNVVAVAGRAPETPAIPVRETPLPVATDKRKRRRRKSRPRRGGRSAERNPPTGPIVPIAATPLPPPPPGADASLRQRAVAKLKMFNFHLNWDLHMTQCKPCGPRSAGNILTRRLCRNRRREDNELYRSNSFKFERFDRKEGQEQAGCETLPKQVSYNTHSSFSVFSLCPPVLLSC